MLLDPETLDLAPRGGRGRSAAVDGDPRFKLELPAAQLEIVGAPAATVGEPRPRRSPPRARDLVAAARAARRASPAPACTRSPRREGELNAGERYDAHRAASTAPVARRQLVCALQVHVAVGGADRALAVHNALRAHLPELAALAANGAVPRRARHGLASVRPLICGLLPRQGVPPALSRAGRRYAEALRWGARRARADAAPVVVGAAPAPDARHARGARPRRAGDGRRRRRDRRGRPRARRPPGRAPRRRRALPRRRRRWRIEENRWSACRHGVEGELADLATGERAPDARAAARAARRARAGRRGLGCAAELARARALVSRNGALRQRERGGRRRAAARLAAWLAERFLRASARRAGAAARLPAHASRRHARSARGPLRRAARRACAAPPARRRPPAARRSPTTRWPTTTSSSRSTSATSCTTAGFDGVDERWEWEPGAAGAARAGSRRPSRTALRAAVPAPPPTRRPGRDGPRAARDRRRRRRPVAVALRRGAGRRSSSSASSLVHRSAYQLKEADPHSWAIPRLSGRAEGGARGDPGRRVRRRAARPHPRRAVRRRDGGARARPRLRRLPRRAARGHARHRQPDVAASACTAACAARSSATSRCSR